MNKYLIAFTKYKNLFSIETELATYCTRAETMKEAINNCKDFCDIINIIAVSKLDESVDWEDLD